VARAPRLPKWSRWQTIVALALLAVSIALFVVQAFAPIWFGREVDFGYLPVGLLTLSVYVIFGLNLRTLVRQLTGDEERDGD
jgi:hypothetical protein